MGDPFFRFHEVFEKEIAAINERRARLGRPSVLLEDEGTNDQKRPIKRPTVESDVVGLALSGGGIRSASFCLGAMQALDQSNVIDRIDYLSTVSGGGYIGTSMSAAMSKAENGKFPFPSELHQDEPAGLQHIRDHSNYLFPQGIVNLFCNIVVYLRGLMANVLLVLPMLLLAAAFTIHSNPEFNNLTRADVAGVDLNLPIEVRFFGITLNAMVAFFFILAVWAVLRSLPLRSKYTEISGACAFFGCLLIAILVVAFCELQPLALYGMFVSAKLNGASDISGSIVAWMKVAAAALAPLATVIGFLGKFLGDALKRTTETPGFSAAAVGVGLKLAILVAAVALPIVLWVVYLYLSYWGISDPKGCAAASKYCHAPDWIMAWSKAWVGSDSLRNLYLLVGVPALIIGWLLSPNANSLHRLYRDRLSKAFLFDPRHRADPSGFDRAKVKMRLAPDTQPRNTRDLVALDDFCIHDINTKFAPYHLINAALNIGGSKYANRRGRNADFFIFSPQFTGSEATQYVPTKTMEEKAGQLNLATAMAISGAAASSNMGANTIKPLTPTLALLNVRLGYWLINPFSVATGKAKLSIARLIDKAYFAAEMFGRLREDSDIIYLTDGGHIENLGIYELLRRRCKLIVAIDAEADSKMSFGSLITLERYARIDLGTRIDLPWASIRDATFAASGEIAKSGGLAPAAAPHGPHCAVGRISYPEGREGILIYVKSSLSGDENDYVVDYKRRYPDFPHETTADQLFSEEQFEVYRALGFHAVKSWLAGEDLVAMRPAPAKWTDDILKVPLVESARKMLGLS